HLLSTFISHHSSGSIQHWLLSYLQKNTICMNKLSIPMAAAFFLVATSLFAQHVPEGKVPAGVKSALRAQYPNAKSVTWEREKGNFEANWGGASKEDNSVVFKPDGSFVEMVVATPVADLPPAVA